MVSSYIHLKARSDILEISGYMVRKMTRDFIQKAANEKLIAPIIEGTRIADHVREESEELVFKESRRVVCLRV
ncbi:MAG TPA: hypothetical protein VEL11_05520 [Candidatus Bathyarchaeia archaeon]|nr:hypothetical protein [Candidatus Bathyarchaeia archaeon]